MMCLVVVDVFGRYLFNSPVVSGYELTRLALGVSVFAALPLVTLREEHVCISLLDNLLYRKHQWLRMVLSLVFSSVVLAIFSWRLWIMGDGLADYNNTTRFLGLPLAPFAYFMSITSAVAVVLSWMLAWVRVRQRLDGGGYHPAAIE